MKDMTLKELALTTRGLAVMFDRLVGPWSPAVMVSELTAEVGTLADSMMIKEGHRPPRDGETPDLEDDIADVLFMLVRIADHYGIDLDHAYDRVICSTRKKLEQLLADQTPLDS